MVMHEPVCALHRQSSIPRCRTLAPGSIEISAGPKCAVDIQAGSPAVKSNFLHMSKAGIASIVADEPFVPHVPIGWRISIGGVCWNLFHCIQVRRKAPARCSQGRLFCG